VWDLVSRPAAHRSHCVEPHLLATTGRQWTTRTAGDAPGDPGAVRILEGRSAADLSRRLSRDGTRPDDVVARCQPQGRTTAADAIERTECRDFSRRPLAGLRVRRIGRARDLRAAVSRRERRTLASIDRGRTRAAMVT